MCLQPLLIDTSTGESPWVLDMIRKHHGQAKETKAIVAFS